MALPNALSTAVDGLASLADALAAVFRGDSVREGRADRERIAARFIASHHGPSASERILDAISGMSGDPALFEPKPVGERIAARLQATVRAAKRALGASGSHRSGHDAYVRHIFPDLSVQAVQARIGRLRSASGRFGEIAVGQRGPNLFELHAA